MTDSFEGAEKERGDGDALEVEMAAMPADSGKVKESTGLGSDDEKLSQVYEKSKDDETLSHVFAESQKMAQEKQKKDEAQAEEDLQATLEASKLTAVTRGLPPSPGHPEASHSWGSRLRNSSKKRSQVSPEQTPERKRRPRARQLGRAGSSPVLGSSPDWPTGSRQPSFGGSPPPTQRSARRRSRSPPVRPNASPKGNWLGTSSYDTPEKSQAVKNSKLAHDACSAKVEASLGGAGGGGRGKEETGGRTGGEDVRSIEEVEWRADALIHLLD